MLFGPPLIIFIISPQPWGGFRVSKHHYAIELAKLGHEVYFIEPPTRTGNPGSIKLTPTAVPRITTLSYRPWFPYGLKFHCRPLFDWLMRRQAHKIVAAIGKKPDIVGILTAPISLRIFEHSARPLTSFTWWIQLPGAVISMQILF